MSQGIKLCKSPWFRTRFICSIQISEGIHSNPTATSFHIKFDRKEYFFFGFLISHQVYPYPSALWFRIRFIRKFSNLPIDLQLGFQFVSALSNLSTESRLLTQFVSKAFSYRISNFVWKSFVSLNFLWLPELTSKSSTWDPVPRYSMIPAFSVCEFSHCGFRFHIELFIDLW